MNNPLLTQAIEKFREKTNTYDKDGGFIVYVEGYDNEGFDVDLIESFLTTLWDTAYGAGVTDHWEAIQNEGQSQDENGHTPQDKAHESFIKSIKSE